MTKVDLLDPILRQEACAAREKAYRAAAAMPVEVLSCNAHDVASATRVIVEAAAGVRCGVEVIAE